MEMNLMNQYQTRRKSLDTAMRHLYRNGIANIITSKKRSKIHGKITKANSSTGNEKSSVGSKKTENL